MRPRRSPPPWETGLGVVVGMELIVSSCFLLRHHVYIGMEVTVYRQVEGEATPCRPRRTAELDSVIHGSSLIVVLVLVK